MKPPFFILGSQRSGTTLLRLIFNAHPELAVPEEGTFLFPCLRREKKSAGIEYAGGELTALLQYFQKNTQFQQWNLNQEYFEQALSGKAAFNCREIFEALYGAFARQHNKTRWADKTPSFFRMVPTLAFIFPEAKFIHLIRDGRDVYLSQKKMGTHAYTVGSAALEWKVKVRIAQRDLRVYAPGRWIEIRYEDLLTAPETVMPKLCQFVELSWLPEMLNFWRTSEQFIGKHHSKSIFKSLDPSRANRWKEKLLPAEIRKFEKVAGDLLASLGYETNTHGPISTKEYAMLALELLTHIPMRAFSIAFTRMNLGISARFGLKTEASGKGEEK